jgi:RimJ/RimL family protein N-acetyltransferase
MKLKVLTTISSEEISMRSIELKDIEFLRRWKNDHKEYFFNKNEISTEDQLIWYNKLIKRNDDHMFIIENEEYKIGCIGARIYEDFVDVYNVILGEKAFKGKYIMTNAMEATIALCNLFYKDVPIRVRVLKNNPAVLWYQKIGFTPIDYLDEYILMQYDNSKIKNVSIIF